MSRHDTSIFFYDWKYFLIVSKLAQIHLEKWLHC